MKYTPERGLAQIAAAERIVIGQLGQTLDGRVATVTGESLYINGRCALTHLHRLRAAVDALIVGAGTVALDNPRMTVRLTTGDTPVRVIVDPSGRVPGDSQCLHDAVSRVIVIRAADRPPITALPAATEIILLPTDSAGTIPPGQIIDALAAQGLYRVLIEGGPATLACAMQHGCVDALHVMVAPMLLGSGKPGLTLPPIASLANAVSPSSDVLCFEDGDVLFACDLRKSRKAVVGFAS